MPGRQGKRVREERSESPPRPRKRKQKTGAEMLSILKSTPKNPSETDNASPYKLPGEVDVTSAYRPVHTKLRSALHDLPRELLNLIFKDLNHIDRRAASNSKCGKLIAHVARPYLFQQFIANLSHYGDHRSVFLGNLQEMLAHTRVLAINTSASLDGFQWHETTRDQRSVVHRNFNELVKIFKNMNGKNSLRVLTFTPDSFLDDSNSRTFSDLITLAPDAERIYVPPTVSHLESIGSFRHPSVQGELWIKCVRSGDQQLELMASPGARYDQVRKALRPGTRVDTLHLLGSSVEPAKLPNVGKSLFYPAEIKMALSELRLTNFDITSLDEFEQWFDTTSLTKIHLIGCKGAKSIIKAITPNASKVLSFSLTLPTPVQQKSKSVRNKARASRVTTHEEAGEPKLEETLMAFLKEASNLQELAITWTAGISIDAIGLVQALPHTLELLTLRIGHETYLTAEAIAKLATHCPNLKGLGIPSIVGKDSNMWNKFDPLREDGQPDPQQTMRNYIRPLTALKYLTQLCFFTEILDTSMVNKKGRVPMDRRARNKCWWMYRMVVYLTMDDDRTKKDIHRRLLTKVNGQCLISAVFWADASPDKEAMHIEYHVRMRHHDWPGFQNLPKEEMKSAVTINDTSALAADERHRLHFLAATPTEDLTALGKVLGRPFQPEHPRDFDTKLRYKCEKIET